MPQVSLSSFAGAGAQFFDNNGVILSGGKIYAYAAGTTTPQATYTSISGATPHPNPIVLDSAGRVPGGEIWLTDGAAYKFVVETSTGILIGTYDNINEIAPGYASVANHIGNGVTTVFGIGDAPSTKLATDVYINGVYQEKSTYSVSGSDLTFTQAPPLNSHIEIVTRQSTVLGATSASSVSYTALGVGAVQSTVQDKLEEWVSPEDYGAVGDGVTDDTPAFIAARAASSNIIGRPGAIYVIGDWQPGSRTNIDLRGARFRRAPGASCALNFSNVYGTLQNAGFDQNIYLSDGLVDPTKCAVSTIVAGPAANTIEVADASTFEVGMIVFWESQGTLATSTVPGTPREEANIITGIAGNVLTLAVNRDASVTVGGKIVADFPLLRLGVGTFQPTLSNLTFQRFVVGLQTGGAGASAGNAAPIIEACRFSDYVGAAIVQRENFGVEIMSNIYASGVHSLDSTHIATPGQTVFTYNWNISPRCHRGGVGNRTIRVFINNVEIANTAYTIDDVAGTITLVTPATGGETVRVRNNEFSARAILCKGVSGSVNSMGRMTNSALLDASVGIEVQGGVGGVEFMYGSANTIDTCSFSCVWLKNTQGLNLNGWSLLFSPYPLITGAGVTNVTFSPLWTSVTPSGEIHNPSAYPNRFDISATAGNDLNIPRVTWFASGGQTINVPGRIDGDALLQQTPHSGVLTIDAGAITVTGSFHRIQTEGGAATDDLDTINGPALDGMHLYLIPNTAGEAITVKDATGNINLAGDCLLNSRADTLHIMWNSVLSSWVEISRSNNA